MRKMLFGYLALGALCSATAAQAAVPLQVTIEGTVTHVDSKSIDIDGRHYILHPDVAAALSTRIHAGERVHVEVAPTPQGATVQSVKRLN
jgi:hypothetical protein